MIRLADPAWLVLAILALPLLSIWLWRRRFQRFPVAAGVGAPGHGGSFATAIVSMAGIAVALALIPLALAMARPQEVLARTIEQAEGVDIVVALDVSTSMSALDFKPTDRLGVAKETIRSFLESRPDDRIGLVVFAGQAVTICPLTLDKDVAGRLLDQVRLEMLPDGTAIGMGLGTAVARLKRSETEEKIVVLVTDGDNNAGQLDPMTAAELASSEGIEVHTVLVGSSGPVDVPVVRIDPLSGRRVRGIQTVDLEVNPELLASIARRTGGQSFRARDTEALARVFEEIDSLERTEFEATRLVRTKERFEPIAMVAAILLLIGLFAEGLLGRTMW